MARQNVMYWNDVAAFLRILSPLKIWNTIALYSSYMISRWIKKPVQWGAPMSIAIEPTTACNLRCPECPSGLRQFTRDQGNLKSNFFQNTLDQISDRLMYLIFYFQGEPYINPEFLNMVEYAKSKKIYTITSTNGHFLNDKNARKTVESGLDRLIISVDGTTQEVYSQYRKEGKLENVLEGARKVVEWKKELGSTSPHIVFQFLVVKPNEHQIDEVYRLAEEIGVDEVKLKSAQVYHYKNGNPLIPENETYSRYKKQKDGTYKIKNYLKNSCWKLWHSCVITWDGLVIPCCFDKDADYQFGDLKSDSFSQIWHDDSYNAFRNKILHGRNQIDICNNCTEGCKVWLSPHN